MKNKNVSNNTASGPQGWIPSVTEVKLKFIVVGLVCIKNSSYIVRSEALLESFGRKYVRTFFHIAGIQNSALMFS